MKGKIPEKYWKEDLWPKMEDLLMKLHIDEQRGIDMFLAFCAMDTDCGGTVDVEECFAYLGGQRSRFTERIWFTEPKINEDGEHEEGLAFEEFAIVCWNYCTMSAYQLGQVSFEIFDVEKADQLEQPDIEAMYRLLWDCEEHDDYYVNQVPYDKNDGFITKDKFCEHVAKKKHIIEPAINYQKRLRSKMGGYILWENLAGFRRRMFSVYDNKAATQAEAVLQIVASEDPNRRARKMAAEGLLLEKKMAMEAKAREAEEELRAIERSRAEEQKRKEMSAEDRFMKLYWVALDEKRSKFEATEFLVDDSWKRREMRLELYDLLDSYKQAADEYWENKDAKELEVMCGTDEDHEARYKDLIKTPDGKVTFEFTRLKHAIRHQIEKYEQKMQQSGALSKPKQLLALLDSQVELEKKIQLLMNNRAMIAAGALKSKTKAASLRPVEFSDETALIRSLISKKDDTEMKELSRKEIWEDTKSNTIAKAETFIETRRTDREMDLKRVEFEMATTYGSRITQWEYCWDRPNEKFVYVNTDTLEVIHAKTAICEACDSIFDQSDKKCKGCDLVRSTKNQLLYRPLGFKDIRID
eukprot:GSChrysophyteH1.ASY1.ANO1.2766.1 assembled CDS